MVRVNSALTKDALAPVFIRAVASDLCTRIGRRLYDALAALGHYLGQAQAGSRLLSFALGVCGHCGHGGLLVSGVSGVSGVTGESGVTGVAEVAGVSGVAGISGSAPTLCWGGAPFGWNSCCSLSPRWGNPTAC
jgi:hypothetical protein